MGKNDSVWWEDLALELIGCQRRNVVDLFWNVDDGLFAELVLVDLVCGLTLMDLVDDVQRLLAADRILFATVCLDLQIIWLALILAWFVLYRQFI